MRGAAGAILGLELAADVGEQEAVVGPSRVHAELVRIEEQRRDRALVDLLRLRFDELAPLSPSKTAILPRDVPATSHAPDASAASAVPVSVSGSVCRRFPSRDRG